VSPPRPDQPACDFYLTRTPLLLHDRGQTAPGGGIQIAGAMLRIENNIHDVVIRHVRFRNTEDDNIQLVNNVYNVVIDHCSLSWAEDEAVPWPTTCMISASILRRGRNQDVQVVRSSGA